MKISRYYRLAVLGSLYTISNLLYCQSFISSDNIRQNVYISPSLFIYVNDDNNLGPWDGSELYPYQNIPEGLDSASTGYTVVVKPGFYEILENETVGDSIGLFLFNGVNVRFHKDKGLNIAGYLNSAGYHNDSIVFTSFHPDSTWSGLKFENSVFESELRYCLFNNVSSVGFGGAAYVKQASLEFYHSSFQGNTASYGAAIYCDTLSSAIVEECKFNGNIATVSGGGIFSRMAKSLTIKDSEFQFNQASVGGGALAFENTPAEVSETIFKGNQANKGGVVYFYDVNLNPVNFFLNSLDSNLALSDGGGFYIQDSDSVFIHRNLVTQNTALRGGGFYMDNVSSSVFNNNILANQATDQGGGLFSLNGNAGIFNNIFWFNVSPSGNQINETGANVRYNNIEGGYTGPGNIASYPIFEDTTLPDFHLRYLSPCIDAGDPLSEFDPDTTVSDIGIYYFHHHPIEVLEQPSAVSITVGDSSGFHVLSTWAYLFQWQMSTDNGSNWSDISDSMYYSKTQISGTKSTTLLISNAVIEFDSTYFRCRFLSPGPIIYSDPALLRVYPVIHTIAGSAGVCVGQIDIPVFIQVEKSIKVSAFSLTLDYDETLLTYSGYSNLHPNLSTVFFSMNAYAGKIYISWFSLNTADLENDTLFHISFQGNQGISELIWDSLTPGNIEYFDPLDFTYKATYSNGEIIQSNPPEIVTPTNNVSLFEGESGSIQISANELGLVYKWQESIDFGNNWSDIVSDYPYYDYYTSILYIEEVPLIFDSYQYRCIVSGYCEPVDTSEVITLHVLPTPQSIYIPKQITCIGEVVVPLLIENSDTISAMSLTIAYNTINLTYVGYQNANDLLSAGYLFVNSNDGKIIISWASLDPIIVTDSLLLELKFNSLSGNSSLTWDTGIPGNCELSDFNGDIIYTNFYNGSIRAENCTGIFDLTVYLEGPFKEGKMNDDLKEVLPLYQPYWQNPWDYNGTETKSSNWYPEIVDWGLLELRQTTGSSSSANVTTRIDRQAVLLRNDGKVVCADGINPPHTLVSITENLYLVFWHRNHLGILSANAVVPGGINYGYDFTSGESQVYGGNSGHKELAPGIWGMIAGDINADCLVDMLDKIDYWNPWAGYAEYLETDLNLDRETNNIDKNDFWFPNLGYGSQIPD
jgi:hypothetical protein